MINAIIIDDEKLARQRIRALLADYNNINVLTECDNGVDAIEFINQLKPDLVYLDINMKDYKGFEVLQRINKENYPIVIFVTAYDEYAIKAFDFNALDYLLKPFKDERFHKATFNAIELLNSRNGFHKVQSKLVNLLKDLNKTNQKPPIYKFPIKTNGKVNLVDFNSIKYICASGYYIEIFTEEKKYLLRESLTNLMNQLDTNIFLRIHRSTIININEIKEIIYSDFGEMDVKMADENTFRVSKTNKKNLTEKIGIR